MKSLRRFLDTILCTAMLVLFVSACTTVKTISMNDAFPMNDSMHPSGPPVTLSAVQESLEEDPEFASYKADQTYLGKGLTDLMGFGPLPILPLIVEYAEFHADRSRTDIVRQPSPRD